MRERALPSILLLNAGISVITSGAALVVLLIAPLGVAAVLVCTGLVAVLSFVLGVVADLWLCHGLSDGKNRRHFSNSTGWDSRDELRNLPPKTSPTDSPIRRRP